MAEENPVVCFVEGFNFKNKIEALQNNVSAFRSIYRGLLTPQQIEAKKEMERTIHKQIAEIRSQTKCTSPELRNLLGYSATEVEHYFDEALKDPQKWRKVDEHLTYLELTVEGW